MARDVVDVVDSDEASPSTRSYTCLDMFMQLAAFEHSC